MFLVFNIKFIVVDRGSTKVTSCRLLLSLHVLGFHLINWFCHTQALKLYL